MVSPRLPVRARARRPLYSCLVIGGFVVVACGGTSRDFAGVGGTAGMPADGGGSGGSAGERVSGAGKAGSTETEGGCTCDLIGEGGDAGNRGDAGASAGGPGNGAGSGGAAQGGAAQGGAAQGGASAGSAGAAPVLPPSCVALPANCGAEAASNCCSAHVVSGGTFNRINNPTQGQQATVSDFKLDDYEVTVGRFRKFVSAYVASNKKPPAAGSGKNAHISADPGWQSAWNASLPGDIAAQVSCGLPYQTWTDDPGANEARPINCLSWYTAAAFCIWDDARLPTLSEWSYATVGGATQRVFPWSKQPNDMTIDASYASYDCSGDGVSGCSVTDLLRVGSKPAGIGRYGQSDLAGNVSEWVLDWYSQTLPSPCVDCATFDPSSDATLQFRDIMGGSFKGNAFNQQSNGLSSLKPLLTEPYTGVRCARD